MIQLLIIIVLIYVGAQAERLRWQPFAWIAAGGLLACYFQSLMRMDGINALGENGAALFEPRVFLSNWAFGVVLWSAGYLIGHGIGRLVRATRRKPPPE